MYLYVPDTLAASPPVLVAIHYCGGSANAYFTGTGYAQQADQHGFIVIYPQTTSSDGCFDVHSDATLKHDGGSDSAGIVSMVQYAISMYGADASRVYVTGTSSGAMMTNVLLGAYPDVFRGGAAFAGVPYACFAGQSAWNSACANGQTTKTAQEWGDLVRAAYPGYAGARPRVQLWHGDQDTTLNFHNFGEEIKQWTNVLGVSETPTTTEQNAPQSSWTRTRYNDANGVVRVEAVLEAGMTHNNISVVASEVVRFFGLDGAVDPGGSGDGGTAGTGGGAGGSSGGGAAPDASAAGSGGMRGGVDAGAPDAASNGAATGTGAAGGASGSGAGAGTAIMNGAGAGGASGSSPAPDQSGLAPLGVAGADSAPHAGATSGSCSVHTGKARGAGTPALMMIVFGAALRRVTPSRRRDAERSRAPIPSRGTA